MENIDLQKDLQRIISELELKNKQQAEELQRANDRLEFLSRATQDAVWEWDLKTSQLIWNYGFTELFGHQKENLDPSINSWYDNIHPDDQQRVLKSIHDVIDNGGSRWSDEYRFLRADGSYAIVFDRGYCIHDSEGKPYRMVGSMVDMTQKRISEREQEKLLNSLKESEARWSAILNQTSVGIAMLDLDMKFCYVNERFVQIVGHEKEELLKKTTFEITYAEDRGVNKSLVQDLLENGKEFTFEKRYVRADNSLVWISITVNAVRDENGKIHKIMGVCNDISNRKNSEEQLKNLSEDLLKANRELKAANDEINSKNLELNDTIQQLSAINADLDNFIYTASHDLKAPISNIEGLMNTLIKNLPPEVYEKPMIKKVVTMIDLSINRFKNTIAELTEITKLQKQAEEQSSLLNLSEIFKGVELDLDRVIKETGALLEINVESCPEVKFSEKNLRSIIYNLISNAIKYHSPTRTPEVYVHSTKMEGFCVLTVQDNGLGIDPSNHEKIFSMFKRVHSHVEGSGIGLYIVKKIVENSGGRIEVQSELGRGATFTVYLKI